MTGTSNIGRPGRRGPSPVGPGQLLTTAGRRDLSSPAAPPPLDLEQVASALASLRSGWTGQGLRPAAHRRDARAVRPQPLLPTEPGRRPQIGRPDLDHR